MNIYTLPHGMWDTNTYVLSDGNECAVIDCGAKAGEVVSVAEKHGLNIKYIILTHGHFDHTYHVRSLNELTEAKLCLHESELELYRNPDMNGYGMFGGLSPLGLPEPDVLLQDGSALEVGGLKIRIIHTPGHTPGSICILADDSLFSGDTLFQLAVGRTDLPGGNSKSLYDSIKRKLFSMEDGITVYPGHGPRTTIGFERANNPHV